VTSKQTMAEQTATQSDSQGGDPALLNRVAWARRWNDRSRSVELARCALKTAAASVGKRSRVEQGLALRTLAWQAKWRGDFDSSLDYCLRAETLLPEAANPAARGDIYAILGVIHYSRHRLDLANCAVDRGFHLLRKEPEETHRETYVDLLATRATIQRYSGEKARSGITLGRARELAREQDLARVDHNIARWLQSDGDPRRGLEHAERALEIAHRSGNRVILPYAHEVAGACRAEMEFFDAAAAHFAAGFAIASEDKDQRAQCQIIREHGNLELARGNTAYACDLFRTGASIAADLGYQLWQKTFALSLAKTYETMGDLGAALDQHKLAWRLIEETRCC
jgi:tetratricopeptide (TPR) repeat protein